MRIRLIAIGTRMPAWVAAGFADYAKRLRASLRVDLLELEAGRRSASEDAARAIATESRRLLEALGSDELVVALDERGIQRSTLELSQWLGQRMQQGRDLALLVGGPDGFGPEVLARADERWSLSKLTLPHAMVRVVVIEQLYRAHSLLTNHPYHRAESAGKKS